jgi:hypothetical protein
MRVIMVYYEILSQHLPEKTEENHGISQSGDFVFGPNFKFRSLEYKAKVSPT